MAEVEVDEIHGGWRVVAGQKDGVDIVVEVTGATLKANQIRAVLTVRVDDAVAFRDTCSLTSQRGRAKIIAALQAKGIAVDDGVLVILDEACRMPSRRPAAASATGSDATRTVPLPNLKDRSTGTEGLRALLNAGNRRGVTVPRCVGDQQELVDFPVFCPKVLAGIGSAVPDTVRDRSVDVQLVRKKPGEKLPKLRQAILRQETAPIREALGTWASTAVIPLRAAEPSVPDELHDRAADAWEPLLAIADSAGGDWPTRARSAARTLHCADLDKDNVAVLLLRAIRDEFDAARVEKMLTWSYSTA